MRRVARNPRPLSPRAAYDRLQPGSAVRARRLPLAFSIVASVLAAIGSTVAHGSAATQVAFVRVNQVGYPAGAPKRAYLLSASNASGAAFSVKSPGGSTVLRGRVGRSRGRWSRRFPFVYALDFGAVRKPGTYTISVHGRASATSPPFRIAPASRLYARALANALAFYRNERDGPDYVPSPLRRAPAHLNDRSAMTYATPAVELGRQLQGRPPPARPAHRRLRRLVGRGRLPQVRRDDELHRRHAARRRAPVPGPAGPRLPRLELPARGTVRRRLAGAHVARPDPHALLPGRDRLRQRLDRRRPRHLAAPSEGRHLRRVGRAVPLHPATGPSSGPGRPARRSARTSPAATRRRSRSATGSGARPTRRTRTGAFSTRSTSSPSRTPTRRSS